MARKRRSSSRRRGRGGLGSLGVPLCPCSPAQMAGLRGLGAGNEDDPYGMVGDRFANRNWRGGIEMPGGRDMPLVPFPGARPREDNFKSTVTFLVGLAAAAGGGYFVYKKWFSKPSVKASQAVVPVGYSLPPADYVTAQG